MKRAIHVLIAIAYFGCGPSEKDTTGTPVSPFLAPMESFRLEMERYPTDEEGLMILFEETTTPEGDRIGPFLVDNSEFREEVERLTYRRLGDTGYEILRVDGTVIARREQGAVGNEGHHRAD